MPERRVVSAPVGWADLRVGYEAALERTISQADIEGFATLTGDVNPIHLDEGFARRTPFGRPIAHGMLSASFVSTVIGTLLPGPGALWTGLNMRFLRPAFAGDALRVRLRVRHRSEATRTLVLDVAVLGPHGDELIAGEATVRVMTPEPQRSAPARETTVRGKTPEPQRSALVGESASGAVVVSGGGRGLGAAIAARLAAVGYLAIVNYRADTASAHRVVSAIEAAGGRAIAVAADVADERQVAELIATAEATAGPIVAVVHCAAMASSLVPLADLDWSALNAHLETQVHGAFNLAKSVLPGMRDRKAGRFVFLGSVAADGVPPAHQADYVVAKSALVALARTIAVDHGADGITANVVAPGMTNSGISLAMPEKARLVARMQSPLRRLSEPDDIADVVAFLLSPAARQITGQTIRVSGGSFMA